MLTGTKADSLKTLKDFYNEEYQRGIIKDEQCGYRWIAQNLLKPHISGKRILDIGCGGGYLLKELENIASSLTGIDISEVALNIAKATCPSAVLQEASAENLPFGESSFDCVVCLGSLEHFLDINKALKEMGRVLSSDGWIFVMVPNLFWYKDVLSVLKTGGIENRNQQYELFATPKQWEAIISEAGLKVVMKHKYNGISANRLKQWLKDLLIPTNLSYHLIYGMRK